jgi:transposase
LNSKLTDRDANFIRVFHEFGFTKPQLAREYGIHVDTVRNVITGRSFHGQPAPSKSRKLTDDQVRQVRLWSGEGLGEVRIAKRLGNVIARSTVRQIVHRKSYQDVT